MNTPVWVGLIAALFAIYMLKNAIKSLQQAQESLHWPSVEGEIIECGIFISLGGSNVGGKTKSLNVKYKYDVDGRSYKGERESLYTLRSNEVEELDKQYKSNPRAQIYYNPVNPTEATLIVGPRKNKKYSDILIACVALLVSASIVIAGYLGYIG